MAGNFSNQAWATYMQQHTVSIEQFTSGNHVAKASFDSRVHSAPTYVQQSILSRLVTILYVSDFVLGQI
jgi:hypothetical protein